MKEIPRKVRSGLEMFILTTLLFIISVILFVFGITADKGIFYILSSLLFVVWLLSLAGFFTLQPNEAAALILFGDYRGTVKVQGWLWANPFYTKRKISLRSRNFNSDKLKVNDQMGNPIEIATVIVWKVQNTAEALFDVDNYIDYVEIQSESALRHLAGLYPYDVSDNEDQLSLRGSSEEVSEALKAELRERLSKAGVSVEEARLSHLAYSPEIAAAMLQRQQASAIIAARQKIVEGAVGMVEMALKMLNENGIVELDEERKAAMVSNLLVVLCGERSTQPVINAGTLHN